jgi:hypothetical protein
VGTTVGLLVTQVQMKAVAYLRFYKGDCLAICVHKKLAATPINFDAATPTYWVCIIKNHHALRLMNSRRSGKQLLMNLLAILKLSKAFLSSKIRGGSRGGGFRGLQPPPPPPPQNHSEQPHPLTYKLGIVAAAVWLAADKV